MRRWRITMNTDPFEAEILRQAERAKAWADAAKDSPIRQRLKEQGLLPSVL